MIPIIGRAEEVAIFKSALQGNRSEFIAVFGRRRVGKTFLIRNIFNNKFSFHITGIANTTTEYQLANFDECFKKVNKKYKVPTANNWFKAFQSLANFLEQSSHQKKIIFIDEMPWLDTPNANFIQALEHFWNNWA